MCFPHSHIHTLQALHIAAHLGDDVNTPERKEEIKRESNRKKERNDHYPGAFCEGTFST